MTEFPISLIAREDGSVLVAARLDSRCWEHTASPEMVKTIRRKAAEMPSAEVALPKFIQGVPVRIEVVGLIKKRLAS